MNRQRKFRSMCVAGMASLIAATASPAQDKTDHWVGTWATASFAVNNLPASAWPPRAPFGVTAETVREVVHLSIGGTGVRIELSNVYGTAPLLISAASVGVSSGDGNVRAETLRPLAFGGKPNITIPTGASALSDPIDMKVEPLSDLAISLYLPAQAIASTTEHTNGAQTNLRVANDATSQPKMTSGTPFSSYVFLKDVQVLAPRDAGAIVAFGDSITDGAYVTAGSNMRWPDELSRRLQADKHTRNLGVLNAGIGGNRVLHDGTGPNALARLGTDVLDQVGVRYLILFEAINDIGRAYQANEPSDLVTADDLIRGYEQVIERAHEHGIQVIGATVTPYMGAGYSSPAGEQVREAVNQWIRTSKRLDGVIDFDMITRDPANPTMFKSTVDHGDHLHPGDAGYKIMGDAIDLSLFRH
ncbi:MAG: SGNH/GDSL hydrolase family protein [Janthinobacterium lividum]